MGAFFALVVFVAGFFAALALVAVALEAFFGFSSPSTPFSATSIRAVTNSSGTRRTECPGFSLRAYKKSRVGCLVEAFWPNAKWGLEQGRTVLQRTCAIDIAASISSTLDAVDFEEDLEADATAGLFFAELLVAFTDFFTVLAARAFVGGGVVEE